MNSRTQILDEAEILFCRNGFRETTVRQITKRAGVNLAMLNYYFSSKENLFTEMLRRRISAFEIDRERIEDNGDGTILRLLKFTKFYIDLIADHLPFYRLLMNEKLNSKNCIVIEIIDSFFQSNLNVLRNVIEKDVTLDKIKVRDLETIIMQFAGVFVYAILKCDDLHFPLNQENKAKLQLHIKIFLKKFIFEMQN